MDKYINIELTDSHDTSIRSFNVNIVEGLESSVSDLVNAKGYVPTKGDTIYLLPGVNIPRMKLKDLSLNLGIRIVRDPAKASVFFTGKSSLGKITTSKWFYVADANAILENVKLLCNDQFYVDKLETAISATGSTKVCADFSDMRNHLSNNNYSLYNSQYVYGIEDEYQNLYDSIQGKPIYCESELISNINGDDSTIIDEEVYQQLKNMFESSDDDNHVLAMEIMANSNYDKSILYLQMLLSNYNGRMGNSHTRNHVNFKSMLSYFNWAPRDLGYRNSEQIISAIDNKNLLTIDMIKRLYQEYSDDIIRNIHYDNVFDIKEVTIKQEYLEKFNLTSLNLINPEEDETLEVTDQEDEVITDQLLEIAITNIKRNELKSELIAIEEELIISESELNKTEEESNNNQIEETNGDDFEWF